MPPLPFPGMLVPPGQPPSAKQARSISSKEDLQGDRGSSRPPREGKVFQHNTIGGNGQAGDGDRSGNFFSFEQLRDITPVAGLLKNPPPVNFENTSTRRREKTPTGETPRSAAPPSPSFLNRAPSTPVRVPKPTTLGLNPGPITPPGEQSRVLPSIVTPETPPHESPLDQGASDEDDIDVDGVAAIFESRMGIKEEYYTIEKLLELQGQYESELLSYRYCKSESAKKYEEELFRLKNFKKTCQPPIRDRDDQWQLQYYRFKARVHHLKGLAYFTKELLRKSQVQPELLNIALTEMRAARKKIRKSMDLGEELESEPLSVSTHIHWAMVEIFILRQLQEDHDEFVDAWSRSSAVSSSINNIEDLLQRRPALGQGFIQKEFKIAKNALGGLLVYLREKKIID